MTRAELLELLKKARKQLKKYHVPKDEQTVRLSIDTIENALSEQPQVVRCKDCKHGGCRTQNMDGSIFRVVCKKHSTKRNERWMDADWFCADGEREVSE